MIHHIRLKNNKGEPLSRDSASSQCVWEYGDKMWIFDGYGISPDGYFSDRRDFAGVSESQDAGWNNQLVYFDPYNHGWKNAACFGDVPSPRAHASVANMKDKVWLHGGIAKTVKDDLYELNMHSLTWTTIDSSAPMPEAVCASLTPITDSQLLLYAHNFTMSPWILNLKSYTWREHHAMEDFRRRNHTSMTGLNSGVVILGGKRIVERCDRPLFSVMLEPKKLEQSAMKMIYQHRTELPWKSVLPDALCARIDIN